MHHQPHAAGLSPRAASLEFDRVTLTDVSRNYGRRRALARVSLTCRSGEILGLLGPIGAGKSTLLGMRSTLVVPSSGEIRYGPHTTASAGAALRARIGLLAHDLHLYPELSARENLEFFARLYSVIDPEHRAEAALGEAGLGDRADEPVAGFSRGMRQRVALERALMHEPRLALLDEPFTGLDDAAIRGLVSRLQRLREVGAIVVIATHDLDLVDGLLDRAAIFRAGKLVALEDASDPLRHRYDLHLGVGSA